MKYLGLVLVLLPSLFCAILLVLLSLTDEERIEHEYMTSYELKEVRRFIDLKDLKMPVSCKRVDDGFLVTEMETGKTYKVFVKMAK